MTKMESDRLADKKLSRAQLRRREDIVEAALLVFDRDGFEAARMSDIAEEADVAKGTLYLYFDTKEALLEGVIHAYVVPAIARVEQASQGEDLPASEKLETQIGIMLERLAHGHMRSILRLMIAEGPRQAQLRAFYYQNVVSPGMNAIRKTLAAGEASGEFRHGTSALAPQVFAGPPLMSAVWQLLFDEFDPIDLEKVIRDHLDTVLGGIRG